MHRQLRAPGQSLWLDNIARDLLDSGTLQRYIDEKPGPRHAADLPQPIYTAAGGIDGWVSMEVSPLLVDDTIGTVRAATRIFAQAERANLFVKIPGTGST